MSHEALASMQLRCSLSSRTAINSPPRLLYFVYNSKGT